jgi:hypothetical protein
MKKTVSITCNNKQEELHKKNKKKSYTGKSTR